jgi:AraC-like DNA-binding protein
VIVGTHLLDIIFLHSGFMPQCTTHVEKFFDGYFTLQLMTRGGVELFYDDQSYTLEVNDKRGGWFWPAIPGPWIRFHPAPGHLFWTHRYVAFKGPHVSRWISEGLFIDKPQALPTDSKAIARFDELLGLLQLSTRWSLLRAANLLESILLELAEDRDQSVAHPPWLERIMLELRDKASQKDAVEINTDFYQKIARREGMALSTLRRRFAQSTGVALHRYTLQCRVSEARRLLGETDLPIKEIAAQLGYQDVFFFSRQFAKISGTTPAMFRKSRQ